MLRHLRFHQLQILLTSISMFMTFIHPYTTYLHSDPDRTNSLQHLSQHMQLVDSLYTRLVYTILSLQLITNILLWIQCPPGRRPFWQFLLAHLAGVIAGTATFYIISYLYDTTIITEWQQLSFMRAIFLSWQTLLWSVLMSSVVVSPVVTLLLNSGGGSSAVSPIYRSVTKYCTWYVSIVLLCTWSSSFVIPLDWDKPWQLFPICVTYGAFVGQVLSLILLQFKWTHVPSETEPKTKSE